MTAPRTRRRTRRSSGFTLIEVMITVGIMMVGAMALITLQQHTIRSNSYARQVGVATQIAQQWIERLKQDASVWNTAPANQAAVTPALLGTRYLWMIGTDARDRFRSPPYYPDTAAFVSNVYDFRGTPLPQTIAPDGDGVTFKSRVFFCTSIRQDWVYFGRAIRADVRVYWPREGRGASIDDDFAGWCQDNIDGLLSPGGQRFDRYHAVYLSTVVRMNPVTR